MSTLTGRSVPLKSRQELVDILRAHKTYLSHEYGVQRIGLFGSFARNEANDQSDIDLVVEFNQPIGLRFLELSDYLERLLQRPVDLLTQSGIQAIRVRQLADRIQQSVIYV